MCDEAETFIDADGDNVAQGHFLACSEGHKDVRVRPARRGSRCLSRRSVNKRDRASSIHRAARGSQHVERARQSEPYECNATRMHIHYNVTSTTTATPR